jgi:hypothetical protein
MENTYTKICIPSLCRVTRSNCKTALMLTSTQGIANFKSDWYPNSTQQKLVTFILFQIGTMHASIYTKDM